MSATVTSTQLNVRMGSDLRSSGNAALEDIGISPSEMVRALWSKISRRGDDLRQVCEVLELTDAPSDVAEDERHRKATLALRGQDLFAEGCAQLGVALRTTEDEPTLWRDVREDMIAQRLAERGVV